MHKMTGEYKYEISWLDTAKMQTNKQKQEQKRKKEPQLDIGMEFGK